MKGSLGQVCLMLMLIVMLLIDQICLIMMLVLIVTTSLGQVRLMSTDDDGALCDMH